MVARRRESAQACHVVSLCVLLACAAGLSSAGEVGTGRIEGTVMVGPELTARRVRFHLYPDPSQTPRRPELSSMTDELENVVVYLESVPEATAPAPRRTAEMRQEGLAFEPHVLAVARGTTVKFPNRDTVFHNVFSLSKVASFDLGRYPSDSSKSVRFDKPGPVKVFCHIHSDMTAIILVLDNPYFASPQADGRFVIEGVPPGEYRVVAWHERAKRSAKKIRVEAGKASVLNFSIPLAEVSAGG